MNNTDATLLAMTVISALYWPFLKPLWARAKIGVGWAASSLAIAAFAPITLTALIVRLVLRLF